MPAMSPTMVEGNIGTWKVKEGESFTAGDVLLEIETDKAQMDVEAQEDGKMAKITQGDGTKGVKVGSRIAVIADLNDDLSTLEIPPEETISTHKESPVKTSESTSKPPPKSVGSEATTQGTTGTPSKQHLPLLPSVASLLLEHRLPSSEADKIPATGPKGRLLKGDVLAYVGTISPTYPKSLSDSIVKRQHLDLSSIKISASSPPAQAPAQKDAVQAAPPPPQESKVGVSVNLSEVMKVQQRIEKELGVFMPLSTFMARAADISNDDLPLSRNAKPTQDHLFNQILGLDHLVPSTGRGNFAPQLDALPMPSMAASKPKTGPAKTSGDIIDILTNNATCKGPRRRSETPVVAQHASGPTNVISVVVPAGDERRGRLFLSRVKTCLESEPGRLIL